MSLRRVVVAGRSMIRLREAPTAIVIARIEDGKACRMENSYQGWNFVTAGVIVACMNARLLEIAETDRLLNSEGRANDHT